MQTDTKKLTAKTAKEVEENLQIVYPEGKPEYMHVDTNHPGEIYIEYNDVVEDGTVKKQGMRCTTIEQAENTVAEADKKIEALTQQLKEQEAKKAAEAKAQEVESIVADFRDAVTGWWFFLGGGTKDDKLEETISKKLNADNIIEVMQKYEEKYGETFIDAYLGDADSKQRSLITPYIITNLIKRAKTLTFDEDVATQINSYIEQLGADAKDLDDNLISTAVNYIYNEIAKVEKAQKEAAEAAQQQ